MSPAEPPRRRPSIPRTVWALGLVSLCMDVSSEIIHSLMLLFLTTTLRVSVALAKLAALVIVFGVEDRVRAPGSTTARPPIRFGDLARLER